MNRLRKRILSAVTAAAVAFGSIGVLPGLGFPELSEPFNIVSAADTTPTAITTWSKLQSALSAGGYIALTQNITARETDTYLEVPSGKTVTLDLNGFNIDRRLTNAVSDGSVIKVSGSLTVKNSKTSGMICGAKTSESGGCVYVTGGSFTLESGTVSGGTATNGGGVYVGENATFTMNGGTISGNTTENNGGGVFIDNNATFTMNNGYISDNSIGVQNNGGAFTMNGGSINSNFGGVQNDSGTFTMYGGSVSDNSNVGVYIDSGTFTMSDGSISNNSDCGVFVNKNSDFAMSGGSISNNSEVGVNINNSGSFTMSGGSINSNKGGVQNNSGTFTMSGGTIMSNSSSYDGAGVYSYGTFNVSGDPVIFGNKKGTAENNVYLPDGKLIRITGELAESAVIGVTAEKGTQNIAGFFASTMIR